MTTLEWIFMGTIVFLVIMIGLWRDKYDRLLSRYIGLVVFLRGTREGLEIDVFSEDEQRWYRVRLEEKKDD